MLFDRPPLPRALAGDRHNQVQLMTMSAVDFLDQWFETDVLKATMSASGIIGTFLGVRSPGTAYVLLHHYMGDIDGAFRSWGLARAAPARSRTRSRPRRVRSAWRSASRRPSRTFSSKDATRGRRARERRRNRADIVSSSVDPRLTFMKMVGEEHLPPDFVDGRQPLQVSRLVGQSEPRARRPAGLHVSPRRRASPARRDFDLAEHRLHGARLRRCEVRAVLAPAVHRHRHPDADRSVRRAAGQARDVVLRAVRAVSPRARAPGTNSARRSATP